MIADLRRTGTLPHVFVHVDPVSDVPSRPSLIVAALLALAALTLFVWPPAAEAKAKTCAEQIVADWYGDGRVDKIFPLPCYQQAIRSLPVDVLDYSNAKEDILRALAYARKDKPDPGPSGGSTDPGGGTGTSTDGGPTGTGPDGGSGDPGEETSASDAVDTSGPSSVPIPLLILGGLALLLLAAGGAGYVSRRAQARRNGGPPGPA
jgi:hypothetical protein